MPLMQRLQALLLMCLVGCASSGVVDHETSAHDPSQVPAATEGPREHRPLAPIGVTLRGPEHPQAGSEITLYARIERRRPISVPVQVSISLPPGATLVEGEPNLTLSANAQKDVHELRYVVRVDALPETDLELVVKARHASFGFHAKQPYRFGRAAPVPNAIVKDGVEVQVGTRSAGKSVDITPH